ncbi:hypothetical protein KL953_18200, partial [Mycolicibacterium goodii]|uniref:hypothetical protein n=1 Tax=Mycolicibacterium goodii TaxID=134601 RepID=UPI001BDC5B65
LLCSSDFGRSLEESRDDLQSLGYDTPVPLIRSDSYTTLLDATQDRKLLPTYTPHSAARILQENRS